ncbi:hypothetical protein C8J56DRAFT_981766 [Mycena floridula]|nr:hypothetical protein C8J56DRAFT_981766 [Mycena floridula]
MLSDTIVRKVFDHCIGLWAFTIQYGHREPMESVADFPSDVFAAACWLIDKPAKVKEDYQYQSLKYAGRLRLRSCMADVIQDGIPLCLQAQESLTKFQQGASEQSLADALRSAWPHGIGNRNLSDVVTIIHLAMGFSCFYHKDPQKMTDFLTALCSPALCLVQNICRVIRMPQVPFKPISQPSSVKECSIALHMRPAGAVDRFSQKAMKTPLVCKLPLDFVVTARAQHRSGVHGKIKSEPVLGKRKTLEATPGRTKTVGNKQRENRNKKKTYLSPTSSPLASPSPATEEPSTSHSLIARMFSVTQAHPVPSLPSIGTISDPTVLVASSVLNRSTSQESSTDVTAPLDRFGKNMSLEDLRASRPKRRRFV